MSLRERYLSLAACVFVTGALVACTSEPAADDPPAGPVGPVPAGLEHFYSQTLDWGDCAPYATSDHAAVSLRGDGLECARLTVPLDYEEPGGTTIELGVLRLRAGEPEERIGSLVVNPGGPGASGMVAASDLSGGVQNSALGNRFDLVGFDPRGVGASEPTVTCLTDEERDADRASDSELDPSQAGVAKSEAEERAFARKCARRTEHGQEMLANIGTRDVVKDMDVLRSVLGDEKLTYLGYSYGTRIGYTYAETFPGNVRALLLDGALDPEQGVIESQVAQGRGFGKAFDEFAAWCTRQQDCALGNDPARATAEYHQLVRPLIDNPVDAGDGRKLSYEDATTGTIAGLYSEQFWETLNSALLELKRGRGGALIAEADRYYERDSDGSYSTTQDAFAAVHCVDDKPVTDKQKLAEAQRRYVEAAPFLDPGTSPPPIRGACAFWPVPSTSEPHLPDVEGVPPSLIVSATGDPATPYQAGVNLAKAMNGRLLTVEATQHGAFLLNRCVTEIGADYLINGTLPEEGARCAGS